MLIYLIKVVNYVKVCYKSKDDVTIATLKCLVADDCLINWLSEAASYTILAFLALNLCFIWSSNLVLSLGMAKVWR